MEASIEVIRGLRERLAKAALDDTSLTFNTELSAYLELENMLDVGEAILRAALSREESRGAHQRRDFPDRDDEGSLSHSLVRGGGGDEPSVEFLPVTLTRWPPEERVYGRKRQASGPDEEEG